jgi:hypothetical protein
MNDFQLLGMIDIIGFTLTSVYILNKYGFKDFFYGWKEVIKKFQEIVKYVLTGR